MSEELLFSEEPGWSGVFTRQQAPDAYPNGTRVAKIGSDPSDSHGDGARATVLGSINIPPHGIGYFVEWDDLPRHAVVVTQSRLRRV